MAARKIPPIPNTQDNTELVRLINDRFRRIEPGTTTETRITNVSGGGGHEKRCATFNLATDGGTGQLEVGKSTPYACPVIGGPLAGWTAIAKVAATGADIIIDVRRNGASILPAGKITIPAGSTSLVSGATFSPSSITISPDSDLLDAIVVQIGSTAPGGEVSINLWYG